MNENPGSITRSGLLRGLQQLTNPERPVPPIVIAVGPEADRKEAEQIAGATGGPGYEVTDPSQINSVILQAIVAAGGSA